MQPDREEIHQVPVPERHLGVVYQALAEAMAAEQASNDEVDWAPGENGYTEAKMRRLKKELTNEAVVAALGLIADRAPDAVAYSELVHATGRPPLGLRADLAGLTRLCKRLFGKSAQWPCDVYYAEDEATYYMSERVARWWKAL